MTILTYLMNSLTFSTLNNDTLLSSYAPSVYSVITIVCNTISCQFSKMWSHKQRFSKELHMPLCYVRYANRSWAGSKSPNSVIVCILSVE